MLRNCDEYIERRYTLAGEVPYQVRYLGRQGNKRSGPHAQARTRAQASA